MAKLLLSVMGAFAKFERALIRIWQRPLEGIELGKRRGVYRGWHRSLDSDAQVQLSHRAIAGDCEVSTSSGVRHQPTIRVSLPAICRGSAAAVVELSTGTESPDTVPVVGHRPSSGARDPDDLLSSIRLFQAKPACVAAPGVAEEFFAPWEAAQPRCCRRVMTRFGQRRGRNGVVAHRCPSSRASALSSPCQKSS